MHERHALQAATKAKIQKLTKSPSVADIERRWHVVDASGKVLGRVAANIARVLRGKHKPIYVPHADTGDFVIVINAGKVVLTGRKREQKVYHRHTGYPGGIRSVTAGRLLETFPERALEAAVRGMLPKTPLGRQMFRKLKVYADATHPHAAQKPEPMEVRT
jgi:large subunit ribosomal protein L13